MRLTLTIAALVALAPCAAAQQQAARARPADPAAPVPALKYESAFSDYRRFRDEPLAPWRDANDDVARAGGHIGILGGAGRQAPSGSSGAKPPAPSSKPAAGSPSR